MDPGSNLNTRRGFLMTLAGVTAVSKLTAASEKEKQAKKMVRIAEFDAAGNRTGVEAVEKIVKSEDEWRKQLTPEQFEVTRRKGTERAGTGKYADNHADGLYHCVCCDTVLFDAKTKFESGTGWPSFTAGHSLSPGARRGARSRPNRGSFSAACDSAYNSAERGATAGEDPGPLVLAESFSAPLDQVAGFETIGASVHVHRPDVERQFRAALNLTLPPD
jgi:hypothetical protein